ncbi:hypothetical protein FB451DRAFT_246737 [Mycena latifolia]|nr:hypothetical protein FB451DRAFT_246737 [Mycena latifolia]
MNATLSVRIPILGTYALSDVKGNLKDGISTTFGISILNGNARFYVSNGKLYVDLSAVVFGTKYGPESIALIPLP